MVGGGKRATVEFIWEFESYFFLRVLLSSALLFPLRVRHAELERDGTYNFAKFRLTEGEKHVL